MSYGTKPEDFRPGLYCHTRTGKLYRAICLAAHNETDELFVVYVALDYPKSPPRLREWATPGKDSWSDSEGTWQRFVWIGL